MRTHVRTQVLTNAAMWERDSRGLTMQINYVALNKRMPLHRVFFTNGHIYIYIYIRTMGVFFRFFFCLYFLLFVHTLWLWFFFFLFFSLYSLHHRSLRARGWVLYNEFFFIITIVFFCLRMNPAHKFRGIFFPFVFFSTGRKKRPRPLDLTDLFCMSFFFCFSLFPPCCRPAAYRAALVGRL